MSISQLLLVTLASLGTWDILRRALPTAVPVLAGKSMIVFIAWVLMTQVSPVIMVSLAVPGALMILSSVLHPEPTSPWGPRFWEFIRPPPKGDQPPGKQADKPAPKIGNRIPRL